jgi:hypothetical protein
MFILHSVAGWLYRAGLVHTNARRAREYPMKEASSIITAIAVASFLFVGSAVAQTAAPASPAPAMDKKAISKTCSDQATAKSLHGKERKKFRASCIKAGGKPSA